MELYRCDMCCAVLDGIDDGKVYELTDTAEALFDYQHLCEECMNGINSDGELLLIFKEPYRHVIKSIEES